MFRRFRLNRKVDTCFGAQESGAKPKSGMRRHLGAKREALVGYARILLVFLETVVVCC
jgi:hypothetical protein